MKFTAFISWRIQKFLLPFDFSVLSGTVWVKQHMTERKGCQWHCKSGLMNVSFLDRMCLRNLVLVGWIVRRNLFWARCHQGWRALPRLASKAGWRRLKAKSSHRGDGLLPILTILLKVTTYSKNGETFFYQICIRGAIFLKEKSIKFIHNLFEILTSYSNKVLSLYLFSTIYSDSFAFPLLWFSLLSTTIPWKRVLRETRLKSSPDGCAARASKGGALSSVGDSPLSGRWDTGQVCSHLLSFSQPTFFCIQNRTESTF